MRIVFCGLFLTFAILCKNVLCFCYTTFIYIPVWDIMGLVMRKLFVLVFAVLCSVYTSSFAAEPFGLKIDEMKFSEFQKKVRSTDMGINSWSKGVMRGIPVEELNIEGLKDAVAIFNEDNILVGLLLTFNKSKFDSLNAMAKQNYQTVSSQIPYVGDKLVKYKDGVPETLKEGALYVSIRFKTTSHLCACGCGERVVAKLSPNDWNMLYNGRDITLNPSIGNWSFDCRSHYFIRKNKIVWASDMTDEQIDRGRVFNANRKKAVLETAVGGAKQPQPLPRKITRVNKEKKDKSRLPFWLSWFIFWK